jgi:hypothetical protein
MTVLTESARLGALECLCKTPRFTSITGSRRAEADAAVCTWAKWLEWKVGVA